MLFSNADEFIKVIPQTKPNLPLILTGQAAIWVESKRPESSTYHLHYLYNNKSFPVIEYINQEWFYLSWSLGKYYTKPLAQIITPLSLRLGTYQTLSVEALYLPDNPTRTPSNCGSSVETESTLDNGQESMHAHSQKSMALGFDESTLSGMVTSTLQETTTIEGTLQAGEIDMYQAFTTTGVGGEPDGDGSYSFKVGGNGPPPGGSG